MAGLPDSADMVSQEQAQLVSSKESSGSVSDLEGVAMAGIHLEPLNHDSGFMH